METQLVAQLYETNFLPIQNFCHSEKIQVILNLTKQWEEIKKKWLYTGLLYVAEVYALQFMNILNSVFDADQDAPNKTREKIKGGKKKAQVEGMYINCLF